MKLSSCLFAITALTAKMIASEEVDINPEVYEQIADIRHPTIAELQKIQYIITNTPRPLLKLMDDREFVPKTFKFIGQTLDEMPQEGKIAVNCPDDERENCIITYCSINYRYPKGVYRLLDNVKKSDFRGHILYRIGGWPNIEGGDLPLIHVPYAFKVCFFREAIRLGYKRILWMDASILPSPTCGLNKIFELIERDGYVVLSTADSAGRLFNDKAASAFGITRQDALKIPSICSAIVGLDLTKPHIAAVIDAWYAAAKHPYGFYSARHEQNAISIILYQMGLRHMYPYSAWAGQSGRPHCNQNTMFIIDRDFVKDW